MLRAEILEITMLYGCATWSPRACLYDTLRRAHNSFLFSDSLHRLAKEQSHRHSISSLDTLIKTGRKSSEAVLRRRRILFAGFVPSMEDTKLPKCVIFRELIGCVGCVRRTGKIVDGVSPGRPQHSRHQRPAMEYCSPGRGVMVQDGGTRGRTFHGELDHCGESQDWTAACSWISNHDGKD